MQRCCSVGMTGRYVGVLTGRNDGSSRNGGTAAASYSSEYRGRNFVTVFRIVVLVDGRNIYAANYFYLIAR